MHVAAKANGFYARGETRSPYRLYRDGEFVREIDADEQTACRMAWDAAVAESCDCIIELRDADDTLSAKCRPTLGGAERLKVWR